MDHKLHVFFFPLMAQGHTLPTIDMAKLCSSRGVKSTLITTPYHIPMFQKSIQRCKNHLGFDISVREIDFPSSSQLGFNNIDQGTPDDDIPKFLIALRFLQEPLEQLLEECRPHALVADMFFPWATGSAAKYGIPRLFFQGYSNFAMCASESIRRNKPFPNLISDSDTFVVPDLPHHVTITKEQVSFPDRQEIEDDFTKLMNEVEYSEGTCYGIVVNSFYELEPDYVDYCKNVLGRKAWNIGPLFLCSKESEDKSQRGKQSAIDAQDCLKWLDCQAPNSVVYACFGSMTNLTVAQLHEIAAALEMSGQKFIWVVRNCIDQQDNGKWFPDGFEDRVKGNGVIVKGWAPQVMILENEAVGCFVTHCGWNSILEGLCAGVPLVTWPFFADQFFNEKLVTDILRVGVAVVGSRKWSVSPTDLMKREDIAKAIRRIMVEEEGLEMRGRAKGVEEMAKTAVEEGGSSYSDLSALLQELSSYVSAWK